MASSLADAIQRSSGETARPTTGPLWPISRWGSSPVDGPDAHDAVLAPGHDDAARRSQHVRSEPGPRAS